MSEAVRTRSYSWGDPSVSATAARTSAGIDVLRALAAGELPGAADPRHPGLRTGIGGAGAGRVRPRAGGAPLQPDRLGARGCLRHRARLRHRLRGPFTPAGRGGIHQPRPQREVPPCRRRCDRACPLRGYGHPPRGRTALAEARFDRRARAAAGHRDEFDHAAPPGERRRRPDAWPPAEACRSAARWASSAPPAAGAAITDVTVPRTVECAPVPTVPGRGPGPLNPVHREPPTYSLRTGVGDPLLTRSRVLG